MRGVLKLTWMELKLFLREPTAVFLTWLLPVVVVYVYAHIWGNWPIADGLGAVDLFVPGLMVMMIAHSGIVGVAGLVTAYRESGILRRLRATPLRPQAILVADIVVMVIFLALGLIFVVKTGETFAGLRVHGSIASVGGAFVLCSLAFVSLGFVTAGLVRTPRAAQSVAMMLFVPMMLLSGATSSRSMMPSRIQWYANLLPMTRAVDLFQAAWAGRSWDNHLDDAAVLLGVLVAGTVVSWLTFRWD
jgi:ABC-2 type transport system permease protein